MAKGILIAAFDFSTCAEDEFNDWYDLEHVPERERVPGFLDCKRWIDVTNPTVSLALYDLESLDVLRSAAYKAIAYENLSVWSKRVTALAKRIMRFEGEQTLPGDAVSPKDAGAVLINAMNCDPAHEAEYNKWYDEEHIPMLSAVPGCKLARRYRGVAGGSHKYVALYHLDSASVTERPEWKASVETPWAAKVRPHFKDRIRILTKPYVRQAAKGARAA
jgi:hypothetical protein